MMWVATNLTKDDLQTAHFISQLESMVCHPRLFVLGVAVLLEILHFIHPFYFHWLSLSEPFPNCIKVLLHPQLVRFHLVHCLRFHIVTTTLSFGEAVNLFYSFDRGAKLISVLVEQVLQLQQIFRRRALFACSDHLKAWLGFFPPCPVPTMFFTL